MRPRGASLEILLLDANVTPPMRIVNKSAVTLVYHQQTLDLVNELGPGAYAPYAWDDTNQVWTEAMQCPRVS